MNKEEIYLDGNAVEMLKQTIGGGGEQNASPYVLSYFDMVELAQGKVINVDKLIEVLETKFDDFDNLVVGDNKDNAYLIYTNGTNYLDLISLELDSDNHTDITVNGTNVGTESTTNNLKQVLLLNKNAIEEVVLNPLYNNLNDEVIAVVKCGFGDDVSAYTCSEFKSLFKEPTV